MQTKIIGCTVVTDILWTDIIYFFDLIIKKAVYFTKH